MAATDRNVLRLGAYEILYTDTPDRAAINEAVELAKRFGSAQSAQFVNGILDKFLHRNGRQVARPANFHRNVLRNCVGVIPVFLRNRLVKWL